MNHIWVLYYMLVCVCLCSAEWKLHMGPSQRPCKEDEGEESEWAKTNVHFTEDVLSTTLQVRPYCCTKQTLAEKPYSGVTLSGLMDRPACQCCVSAFPKTYFISEFKSFVVNSKIQDTFALDWSNKYECFCMCCDALIVWNSSNSKSLCSFPSFVEENLKKNRWNASYSTSVNKSQHEGKKGIFGV